MVFTAIIENIKGNRQKKHGRCLYFGENEENEKGKNHRFTDLIFSNFSLNKFVKLQKYPVSRSENFEQMVESGGSNQFAPPPPPPPACFSSICGPITTKVGIMILCHKISQKH